MQDYQIGLLTTFLLGIFILIGALLYTGSRIAFVLFLISNFIMFLINANKKLIEVRKNNRHNYKLICKKCGKEQ